MEHSVPAIVVAAFGAGQPEGLAGILAVLARVRAAWPALPVRLAFTSNRVRAKWRHRAADPVFRAAHPEVPEEVWGVRGVLATIADLQEAGHRDLVVQPLFIHAGEEFTDLAACVEGLAAIRAMKPRWRPFERLVLGGRPWQPAPVSPTSGTWPGGPGPGGRRGQRPRLGGPGLVGHGNPSSRRGLPGAGMVPTPEYPGLTVVVGLVEGVWSPEWALARLKAEGATRALLKPLLLVAGEHAREDLCGEEPSSWRARLAGGGLTVICDPVGLGENPAWAGLYLTNLREAAAAAGLAL